MKTSKDIHGGGSGGITRREWYAHEFWDGTETMIGAGSSNIHTQTAMGKDSDDRSPI